MLEFQAAEHSQTFLLFHACLHSIFPWTMNTTHELVNWRVRVSCKFRHCIATLTRRPAVTFWNSVVPALIWKKKYTTGLTSYSFVTKSLFSTESLSRKLMKYTDFEIERKRLFRLTCRWWKGAKCKNIITSSIVYKYGLYFGAGQGIFIIWPHCAMGRIRPSPAWSILSHLPDFAIGQVYGFRFFLCWPPPGCFRASPLSFPLWCPKQTFWNVDGVFLNTWPFCKQTAETFPQIRLKDRCDFCAFPNSDLIQNAETAPASDLILNQNGSNNM